MTQSMPKTAVHLARRSSAPIPEALTFGQLGICDIVGGVAKVDLPQTSTASSAMACQRCIVGTTREYTTVNYRNGLHTFIWR